VIKGKLVLLRAIEREDLANYVEWLNDPLVLEYFGHVVPMSLEQEEKWYEGMLEDSTVRNFAIEFKGRHVGGGGFSSIDGRHRSAEVGLFIGVPDLWDRGLGGDALQTLVRFGFEEINLNRIFLRVFAENSRAVHLYETLGFQHEGRMRQAEYRHGRYHDLLWMSLLREEWIG
jgi:RimJ/RimL family protein N-acetyltransferase